MTRLINYRFTFAFNVIAIFYSYLVYEGVFEKARNVRKFWVYLILGLAIMIYTLAIDTFQNYLQISISFLLVFIYTLIIYIPFSVKAFKLSSRLAMEDKTYKNAVTSLGFMGIFYILLLLFFLFDQVNVLLTGTKYSIFYFLGWASGLLALILAYFGYIRPKNRD